MKAKILVLVFALGFPLTVWGGQSDQLERTIFHVQDQGTPIWISQEMKALLNLSEKEDLIGMELPIENCFGPPLTLVVCQPWNPLREVLIIIEPAGETFLREGALVLSEGRNFWLTNSDGKLKRVMFQAEDQQLKQLARKANFLKFGNLLRAIKHWEDITEYEYRNKQQ